MPKVAPVPAEDTSLSQRPPRPPTCRLIRRPRYEHHAAQPPDQALRVAPDFGSYNPDLDRLAGAARQVA